MKVGDWVEVTTYFPSPEYPPLVRVGKLLALGKRTASVLMRPTFVMAVELRDVQSVTPTPKELGRWRAALAKVGLCLLEDKEVGREPL